MSVFRLEYRERGIHLGQLGLWLDPLQPQTGADRVFVSHAHFDHLAGHREVILSAGTAKLMRARLPGARLEHILAFGQPREFTHPGGTFSMALFPAGHIFGSAMALVESCGQRLLYTGDFKLRPSLSAEPCEPAPAEVLIMETTYGRPQYVFPPVAAVLEGVIRFCREALDNEETPVLLGYSLGKSQELLCSLGQAGLPLMLHGAVYKMTKVYEQFGQCFPDYKPYEANSARGRVLLCPPQVINSAMLRNLGRTRTAILTGWAVDPNCRYRYQCDAAFPLSDHADFSELLALVERVKPKQILTLHGFAADFAAILRDRGYAARALSEDEQLVLQWGPTLQDRRAPGVVAVSRPDATTASAPCSPAAAFASFALVCGRVAATSSKLEKVRLLADYFRTLQGRPLALAATWLAGRPFAPREKKVLQLGWAVLRDSLCALAGVDEAALHQVYLKHSDFGETAAELLSHQPANRSLSLEQLEDVFRRLHAARGPLAKTPILTDCLGRCSAIEAKYLVKIITGELRIGLKEGLVEEAIAEAFGQAPERVRQANLLLGDIGQTAELASGSRLHEAALAPFRPVKFMLASPEPTAADVWARMHDGGRHAEAAPQEQAVWLEDKYDGIRCQAHKVGARVALYSRDLKEITATFNELCNALRLLPADAVFDGEILAMRGEEVLPFSELQKRLGRREPDLFMSVQVPIQLVVFDLLWLNGESLLNRPLRERRARLESLQPLPDALRLARLTRAGSPDEVETGFAAARERGNEGLMIKQPESRYTPGRRGLSWVKLKKAFATLDCVVVGAEYGHGKRSRVLSDYTFAVRDEKTGELKTIGKAYSGLTDAEIEELTAHFLKSALSQHGRYFEVVPDTVLEIAFDRLQPSARHNSGLAMRFPRIQRIRTDKSLAEIDTLETARRIADRLKSAPSSRAPSER